MVITDYYKASMMTSARTRYDVVESSGEYDCLESLLVNKRGFNKGGLSLYYQERPLDWKGRKRDMAITKGNINISSITKPDPLRNNAYGDFKGTKDGFLIISNEDFRESGVVVIEIFIARGYKNEVHNLWEHYNDGGLHHEVKALRRRAKKRLNNQDK